MTGTILRCNTRIELTVTEFLRLDRMRGAKRAVPARLHCELEQRHDGDHVAFAQSGEGTMTDSAEWWIRWNAGRRDIAEMPWCLAKDPAWPEDAEEDDPMFCGLPEDHEGAHEWEMRSDLVFTRAANGIGEVDRDRLRAVPREERPQLRIHRWEMVMAVRWPDWEHWLMIWPPEYPDYERRPPAPEWKRHMADADFDDPEWIDPARQFRRDLPVITGDAREQLRRAGDDLRRALTKVNFEPPSPLGDQGDQGVQEPEMGSLTPFPELWSLDRRAPRPEDSAHAGGLREGVAGSAEARARSSRSSVRAVRPQAARGGTHRPPRRWARGRRSSRLRSNQPACALSGLSSA